MSGLREAVSFLTVVPSGASSDPRGRRRAVVWYPVVGLGLGGLLALLTAGAGWLWPAPVRAVSVLGGWVVLTGALHLDGLADCADAAFAPVPLERRLSILRDVHHGTFAVVAVALVLIAKWAVLAGLPTAEEAAAVLLAPVLGRAVIAPVMRARSARADGMGAEARSGAGGSALLVAAVAAVAICLVAFGAWGLVPLAAAVVVAASGGAWLSRRFGGLSGDGYGAIVELAELGALLATSAAVMRGGATAFAWVGR